MSINISESTFRKTLEYLTNQAGDGDRLAIELLALLQSHTQSLNADNIEPIPNFDRRLFTAWKELAELQIGHIGENCWSFPVPFADLAENLSIPIENLIRYLETTEIDCLQLLAGRSTNYLIKSQQVGDLAFHSDPNFSKLSTKLSTNTSVKTTKTDIKLILKVGDRIRVNANRPQYIDQTGTIEQVISVSCRVKLDNDWIAFLPNHCLEKI